MKRDAEVGSTESVDADGNVIAAEIIKKLDANSYATKKTIAQGLLDVALLTANASQLKYVLQVGEQHEFYSLMLGLIITSIILQIIQVGLCIFLGSLLNINKEDNHDNANVANNTVLFLNVLIVIVNIFIVGFEIKENSGDSTTTTTTPLSTTSTVNSRFIL